MVGQHKEPELPKWWVVILLTAFLLIFLISIKISEDYRAEQEQKERNQQLRDSYSRLSDSPEIQEAYEELEN